MINGYMIGLMDGLLLIMDLVKLEELIELINKKWLIMELMIL